MNQVTTQIIVLRRINFQEADRILTVISPDYGKIRVIAKGVRRQKSKLAGGLELLSVNDVTYIVGRSEIYTLVSSRCRDHYKKIVCDIDRTMLAYELIKRVDKLAEDYTGQEFFALLQQALERLDDTEFNQQMVELWFNLQLLRVTGHSPNFMTDLQGLPLRAESKYAFDFDDMTFRLSDSGGVMTSQIKLLRLATNTSNLSKLGNLNGAEEYLANTLKLSNSFMRQQFSF